MNLRNKIKTALKKYLSENMGHDSIREMVLNASDWDDIVLAIEKQYGEVVPLYHATTIENSEIIDREGFKLVHGKNYKSFSSDPFLYFQLGKSDYVSTNRPVLYKLEVPLEFLSYCDVDMDNVDIDDSEISKYVDMEYWDDIPYETRDAITYFIWNNFELDGMELILYNRTDLPDEELFRGVKISKIE